MIEQPAGWEEHLEIVVILVMCLEGVVGREVMCLVGKPWHTVLLSLIKPGRMLKTLCRNENVVTELQAVKEEGSIPLENAGTGAWHNPPPCPSSWPGMSSIRNLKSVYFLFSYF